MEKADQEMLSSLANLSNNHESQRSTIQYGDATEDATSL